MRVATDALQQLFIATMQSQQAQLARTQLQVATGRRILTPSDDPGGALRVLGIEHELGRLQTFQNNAATARERLRLEESVLTSVGEALQRARELAIQANNATQTSESLSAIAVEVRQSLDGLLQLANSTDGAGRYLFAGFSNATAPFIRDATGFRYLGDQGQRQLQIGATRMVADGDPGADVFQLIRNGNGTFVVDAAAANIGTGVIGASSVTDPALYVPDTYTVQFLTPTDYEVTDGGGAVIVTATYTDGDTISFGGIGFTLNGAPATGDVFTLTPSVHQDIFTTVEDLATALEAGVGDPAANARLHNAVTAALENLDRGLERLGEVRARVGARLGAIDAQLDLNDSTALDLTATLSELRDLDYAEALSRLNMQAFGLEAAQQSFVLVQGLSLFNFLR